MESYHKPNGSHFLKSRALYVAVLAIILFALMIGLYFALYDTVAVDPTDIPYGTTIYIDGSPYTAEDCGGAIQGKAIDIFFESHEEALGYGVQQHKVDVPTTIIEASEGGLYFEQKHRFPTY